MYRRIVIMFIMMWATLAVDLVSAEMQVELFKTQTLENKPLAIAQSVSDGRLFVLLEGGIVQIFDPNGQPQERIQVDKNINTLEVSPDGRRLYLGNGQAKGLQLINLSVVYDLPVDNSAIKGPQNAPVTITVFDDFQCPYCARLVPTLESVMKMYPAQVRLVLKHFPLSMHKFARQAAAASIAARNQGKFWEMHDQLFANYNKLNDEVIRNLAAGLGLDMQRFDQDIQDSAAQEEINNDLQLGSKVGVRGTPAVYINGVELRDRSINGFQQAIDAKLN